MKFKFAHISDLHLPPLPVVAPREIINKRLLGFLSWHRKRKHRHRPATVAALERLLGGQAVDHICITGDVTNLGLAREFAAADRWLRSLGTPDTVTFVPGNHDAYVAAGIEAMRAHFSAWLPDAFPSVARHDGVMIIGLSSAVPTPPLKATGRVGRDQLERLASILDEARGEDRLRVLMIHHPAGDGIVGRRKALTDAEELRRVLYRRPVDLVLHGHGHHAVRYELESGGGPIPVFGAGSASLTHPDTARSGHCHVFDLDGRDLRVTHYHYRPDDDRFAATSSAVVTGPSAGR